MAGAAAPSSAVPAIVAVAGGVGGPGPATREAVDACGVTVAAGGLYVGNDHDVRRIGTTTGALTTVAGNGADAGGGNGAAAAQFAFEGAVCGTAVDKAGDLVVADNFSIHVIAAKTGELYGQRMTAGHVYIVGGSGGNADLGNGNPLGVAVDRAGNIIVSNEGMPFCGQDCPAVGAQVLAIAVRTGTFYGQKMTAGGLYALAGVLNDPGREGNTGLATHAWLGSAVGTVGLDAVGNLVLPDSGDNAPDVRVVAGRTGTWYGQKMTAGHIYLVAGNGQFGGGGDGGPARRASLAQAGGVAVDGSGNLVIADGNRVRVVAVRSGRYYGQRMTRGDIYSIAGAGPGGFSGDGGLAVKAGIDTSAVAMDGAGNVVLGCGRRVRVVAVRPGTFYGRRMTAGHIYTVAGNGSPDSGNGGPALKAGFDAIEGTAEDPAGDLAFTDQDSQIWVVMASTGKVFGRTLAAGDSYDIGSGSEVGGVTFDQAGNVVVGDWGSSRVRVIAARTGTFYGQKMTAGAEYTIAGSGTCAVTGASGPATKVGLCIPSAVSFDHAGNLLVSDLGNLWVWVLAARTGTFYGKKMTAGFLYPIAGDGTYTFTGDNVPALKAGMAPEDAVADPAGNVIIPDGSSDRVRLVAASTGTFYGQHMTAGNIYTIAGDGTVSVSGSGSGGPATAAELGNPSAAAVDGSGNVVFADDLVNVVWVVAVRTGTFYGQNMTAGDIYIVAGDKTSLGSDGLGDGGPALGATFDFPDAVAIAPAGELVIGDQYDNRVRAISG